MKRTLILAAALLMAVGCADRRRESPAERAAERVDEIGRNIKEGDPPLHRPGPAEKAERAIEDTFDGK